MEPREKLKEWLINQFEPEHLKFRIFSHSKESNSIVTETQLRLEMTSISPLGVIVYSKTPGDYQNNLKKIMTHKIERLYNNANMTLFDANHSEIHEDRLVNEDRSFEDVNGYEVGPRAQQASRLTGKLGSTHQTTTSTGGTCPTSTRSC